MILFIAEKIADIVAWVLRTDNPKHLGPTMPQFERAYFEALMSTSVILFFVFFYLFCGAVYQLVRYWTRISAKSFLLTASFGCLCLSASLIILFRIYNFWYQDMTGSIYAYYTFTAIIVFIAFIMTLLEYKSLKEPTKKEYRILARKVEEVARKHGLDKES